MNKDDWDVHNEHEMRGWNAKPLRVCDITGQGMDSGFLVNDDLYVKHESNLIKHLRSLDWEQEEKEHGEDTDAMNDEQLIEFSYDLGYHYWTEWHSEKY